MPNPQSSAALVVRNLVLVTLLVLLAGCAKRADPRRIVIWHQMRLDDRLVLKEEMKQFMAEHPGILVEQIYKETEELRSGFIVAAIAG